jgi:hypothetical protein
VSDITIPALITVSIPSPLPQSFGANPFTSNDAAAATAASRSSGSGSASGGFTSCDAPSGTGALSFTALPPAPQSTARPAFESFGFGFGRPSNVTTPTTAIASGNNGGFTSNDAPQHTSQPTTPQKPVALWSFSPQQQQQQQQQQMQQQQRMQYQQHMMMRQQQQRQWAQQQQQQQRSQHAATIAVQQQQQQQQRQQLQRQQQLQFQSLSSVSSQSPQRALFGGSPQLPRPVPQPQQSQAPQLHAAMVPACNGQCKKGAGAAARSVSSANNNGLGMLTLTRAGSIACTHCGERAFTKLALADTDPYQLHPLAAPIVSDTPFASTAVAGGINNTAVSTVSGSKRAVKPVSSYGAVRQHITTQRRRAATAATIHDLSPPRATDSSTAAAETFKCYGVGESVNHASLKSRRAVRFHRAAVTASASSSTANAASTGLSLAAGTGAVSAGRYSRRPIIDL